MVNVSQQLRLAQLINHAILLDRMRLIQMITILPMTTAMVKIRYQRRSTKEQSESKTILAISLYVLFSLTYGSKINSSVSSLVNTLFESRSESCIFRDSLQTLSRD